MPDYADRVLNSFKDLCAPQTFVVRDGTEQQILASELVPGDVIKVTAGDKASRGCFCQKDLCQFFCKPSFVWLLYSQIRDRL